MQKTTVIAVGKLKERFWKDACAEYLKRLSAYSPTTVREIPDSTLERGLLDIRGKQASSEQLATKLESLAIQGVSHVAFVIGGSDGVSEAVRARCDERLSFGPITLPHNLARVVLLEQVYRAHKIIRGEPYHK